MVPLPIMPAGQGFGPADEILLSNLAEHVSVAVHNAEFYRAAIVTSERANVTWPKWMDAPVQAKLMARKQVVFFLDIVLVVMDVIPVTPVYQDIHDRLLSFCSPIVPGFTEMAGACAPQNWRKNWLKLQSKGAVEGENR